MESKLTDEQLAAFRENEIKFWRGLTAVELGVIVATAGFITGLFIGFMLALTLGPR